MRNLVVILLFFSINVLFSSEYLKLSNVKSFTVTDFNNNGKKDLVIQYNDGRFALLINKSDNKNNIKYSEPIYFYKEKISGSKKKLTKGKKILNDYLGGMSDLSQYTKGLTPQKKKSSIVKKQNKKSYDLAILSFQNKSANGMGNELMWLNSGLPELLNYEILLPKKNNKMMSSNKSKKLKLPEALKKSKIVVNGYYQLLSEDKIKLTGNIYYKNDIYKTVTLISNTNDKSILKLVSQLGKQINQELNKIYK